MERIAENITDYSGRYSLNSLLRIYGVSRTVINSRIKALDIKPCRRGKRLYFNRRQLSLLDDLDAHLKAGGNTEEFVSAAIASKRIITHKQQAMQIVESQANAADFPPLPPKPITPNPVEIPSQPSQAQAKEVKIDVELPPSDKQAVMQAIEKKLELIYMEIQDFTLPGLREKLEEH